MARSIPIGAVLYLMGWFTLAVVHLHIPIGAVLYLMDYHAYENTTSPN